jgi:hypothetical protein
VPLTESDRHWGGRILDLSAYAAAIEPFERGPRLEAAEVRELYVRVTNSGSETWPWDAEAGPEIRCAYRWLHPNETVLEPEGHRTSFPCEVPPGESVVIPLVVEAPAVPGVYLLEVDVVHERVRWFGAGRHIPVTVHERLPERSALPASALASPEKPKRTLLERLRGTGVEGTIPRVIHSVWLGGASLPEEYAQYGESWRRHHPGWRFRVWGDHDVGRLLPREAAQRARHLTELSELVRFEVLRQLGGVYVDADVECLRSIEPLLEGERAVVGYEKPGRVGTAVLAAVPGHPLFVDAARQSQRTVGLGANSADATGPYLLTLLVRDYSDVRVLPPETFYPYTWEEPERRHETFPEAYAVHHWAGLNS